MSRKKPNTVYIVRDDKKFALAHVLARSPKGALTVAKNYGIEGGKHAHEVRHVPAEKTINFKKGAE